MNLEKVLGVLAEMRADQGAQDATPLALDESSVRSYDVDGRLHVSSTPISKAAVNPYKGSEIPNYKELGLDKDQVYQLLRHPDELAKAAPTFNNIPLLSKHVPVTAVDHHPELVIGSTGTDAEFGLPYLNNSLVVWAKKSGIDGVESNKKKEISSAYRYRADMTPGIWEGQKYDGVMRDIVGNHAALVESGRAGPDVVVGDSKENLAADASFSVGSKVYIPSNSYTLSYGTVVEILPDGYKVKLDKGGQVKKYRSFELETPKHANDSKTTGVVAGNKKEKAMGKKITRQAAITLGVLGSWLKPKLAMDAKIDLGPMVKGLTIKNFKERKPGIVEALEKLTKGKLAQDGSIGEVAEILDLIDSHDVAEDEPEVESAEVPGEVMAPKHVEDRRMHARDRMRARDRRLVQDDDPTGEIESFLKDKLSGADLQHVCNIMRGGAEDVGEHHAEGEEQLEDLGAATEDEGSREERDNERSEEWHEGKGEKAEDRRKAMDRGKHARDRRHAMDDPPPFKGMPKKGGGGVMDKHAMDTALKSVSEQTEKRVLETQRNIRKAEREVRPWVGDLAMDEAMSADDVYGAALKALNVETKDIHPSAWPTVLKLQPLPGAHKGGGNPQPRVAMDAKSTQSFNEMFPDAARVGLM